MNKNKITTKRNIRASDLPTIIKKESVIRNSVQTTVKIYVFALMLSGYSKSFKNIATYFGISICSISRLLSNPLLRDELNITLNRKVRQTIASYLNSHEAVTAEIIIDATLIERASKKAENVGLYHSNGKKQLGHRVTNIGILLDGKLYIPLAALVHHTRRYARLKRLPYLTEGAMVQGWLRDYMTGVTGLLRKGSIMPNDITFLLDAGYDNAKIQNSIRQIGCHFLMMVKNTRKIGGFQIKTFFTRNRYLPWKSVYFNKDVNGKIKRRKYRIRIANEIYMENVGFVTVVCSEKASGCSKKIKTRRYIAASKKGLSGREILETYARRWKIETWHKQMKQDYGLNDCSASKFISIENHIILCLIAFTSHQQDLKSLPSKKIEIGNYLEYTVRKKLELLLG